MARSPGDSSDKNPSNGSSSEESSSAEANEWAEVEAGFAKVQKQLSDLKDRYSQVRRDIRMQGELRAEQVELERQPASEAIRAELKDIEQQLAQIEVAIESQLFSWESFREIFWQIVRFVGLGIVMGWVLKSLVG